jgi:hypothetical protein
MTLLTAPVPAIPPEPPPLSLPTSAILPANAGIEVAGTFPDWVYPTGRNALLQSNPELYAQIAAELNDRAAGDEQWVRGFRYAPEQHSAAEVRDPQDYTTVDESALHAPAQPTLAQQAGGTLTAATYAYQITAVDANGETTPCAETTIAVTGSGKEVVLTWQPVADGVTYKIYGRVHGSIGLLHTTGTFDPDSPPTWTDTGADSPGAAPPSSNTTGGAGVYTNLGIVEYLPFLIVTRDKCSTFGFEARDFKGRALRWLDNATPNAIEREFWGGALAQAKGYPNNYLCNTSDPNFVDLTPGGGSPAPCSVKRGLQILQDYIASAGMGDRGMIHVQPQTAPNLINVRRQGALMLDVFDNIIVPGTGYSGDCAAVGGGDSSTTAVMFATDMVNVRIQKSGDVFPDTFEEALDRSQGGEPDTIEFRAERFGAAYWDGFRHAAVRVTLAT